MTYSERPVKLRRMGGDSPLSNRLAVSGLVTGIGGDLITQGSAIQPWTAAVAKVVTAPLPVRAVVERAAVAWQGELFLGIAVPVTIPRSISYRYGNVDPVFLYPLIPEMDVGGYFAGLRSLFDGDRESGNAHFQEFARAVQPFEPSREEAEAVIAAIADIADHIKELLEGRGDASVDVFRLRSLMLSPCVGGKR